MLGPPNLHVKCPRLLINLVLQQIHILNEGAWHDNKATYDRMVVIRASGTPLFISPHIFFWMYLFHFFQYAPQYAYSMSPIEFLILQSKKEESIHLSYQIPFFQNIYADIKILRIIWRWILDKHRQTTTPHHTYFLEKQRFRACSPKRKRRQLATKTVCFTCSYILSILSKALQGFPVASPMHIDGWCKTMCLLQN